MVNFLRCLWHALLRGLCTAVPAGPYRGCSAARDAPKPCTSGPALPDDSSKEPPMPATLKLEFRAVFGPSEGRSHCVLRRGPQIRVRPPATCSTRPAIWSSGRRRPSGSRARTARPSRLWRRPGSRCRAWSWSGSARPKDLKAECLGQARRRGDGQDSGVGDRGDHHRRPAGRRARSRSGSRTWRSASGCAPIRSIATRPSARRTRRRPAEVKVSDRGGQRRGRAKGVRVARRGRERRVCWRATWSTSRRMCCIPEEFARRTNAPQEIRRRGRDS